MKKNRLQAGLLAILAGTVLMTAGVNAADEQGCQHGYHQMKGGKHGHDGGIHKMLRGLDLTDAQKSEVETLMKAHKSSMKDQRPADEARKAHRQQMLELITAADFDEKKVKQALASKQAARQQHAVNKMKLQNQVYQLLTPEQQEQYKASFEKQHGGNR